MKLSEKALQICADNYAKNCGGCPLRTVCVKNIGPGQEALNRWVTGINERAEEIGRNVA